MQLSFHERLRSLGAEYDRIIAENAAFRRKFGDDLQRNSVKLHAENIVNPKLSVSGELMLTSEDPDDYEAKLEDVAEAKLEDFAEPDSPGLIPVNEPLQDPFMLPGAPEPDKHPEDLVNRSASARGVLRVVDAPRLSVDSGATNAGGDVRATILQSQEEGLIHSISAKSKKSTKPWSAAPDDEDEDEDLLKDSDEVPMTQLVIMDIIPAAVIILNSILLGVQADVKPESVVWDVFEALFTAFFIVELVGKTIVIGPKKFFCGNDWYWSFFDTFCVLMAIVEMVVNYTSVNEGNEGGGGIMGIMKMLKLFRLGRVVRLLKFRIFAELKLMVQGVFTGLRVLLWAVVLLMILMYLLAMVGRTLYGAPPGQQPDQEKGEFHEFASVFQSWLTMFRCFTEGCADYDGRPLQERMRASHVQGEWMFVISYVLVFLFISIGIFNLIMAVFIDSVNDGSLKKKQRELGASAAKTEYILADKFKVKCLAEHKKSVLSSAPPRHGIRDAEALERSLTHLARRTAKSGMLDESSAGIRKLMERHGTIVSEEEFTKWLYTDHDLIQILDDADVDLSVKFDLFDVLDADISGELDFGELINGLMKCRGPVSKNDVIAIRNKVGHLVKMVTQIKEHICPEKMTEPGRCSRNSQMSLEPFQ